MKHLRNGTTKNKPQNCCIQKLQDLGFSQVSTATGKFMGLVARIEISIIIIIIYHWGILAPTSVLPRYRSRSKVSRNMEFSGFFERKMTLWMHLSAKKLQEMSIRTKSLPSGYRKSCSLLTLPLWNVSSKKETAHEFAWAAPISAAARPLKTHLG